MQTIELTSHIDEDGLLRVAMPDELRGQDVEILVVIQPIATSASKKVSRWAEIAQRVHEDKCYPSGWSEQLKKDMQEFRENFTFEHDKA